MSRKSVSQSPIRAFLKQYRVERLFKHTAKIIETAPGDRSQIIGLTFEKGLEWHSKNQSIAEAFAFAVGEERGLQSFSATIPIFKQDKEEFASLVASLKKHHGLEKFVMNGNAIDAIDAFELLQPPLALKRLDLSHCGLVIQPANVTMLRENGSLAELKLDRCNLSEWETLAVIGASHGHPTWRTLTLNHNDLEESIAKIAKAVNPVSSIENLELGYTRIYCQGAAALAAMLKTNDRLRRLDLTSNFIGEEGMTALAEAVTENTTLRHLDVSENRPAQTIPAFLPALRVNGTLVSLNLRNSEPHQEDLAQKAVLARDSKNLLEFGPFNDVRVAWLLQQNRERAIALGARLIAEGKNLPPDLLLKIGERLPAIEWLAEKGELQGEVIPALQAAVKHHAQADSLLPLLVQDGGPTELLLNGCAPGNLLPLLTDPATWRGNPGGARTALGAVRKALPPVWQTRMDQFDLTAFQAPPISEAFFSIRVKPPQIEGVRR